MSGNTVRDAGYTTRSYSVTNAHSHLQEGPSWRFVVDDSLYMLKRRRKLFIFR